MLDKPNSEAFASPVRSLSRSAWIEFVWRTPRVYREFMVAAWKGWIRSEVVAAALGSSGRGGGVSSNLIGRDANGAMPGARGKIEARSVRLHRALNYSHNRVPYTYAWKEAVSSPQEAIEAPTAAFKAGDYLDCSKCVRSG